MAYKGKTSGYKQTLCSRTASSFCPDIAVGKTCDYIKSPVTLSLLRADIKTFQTHVPHLFEDPLLVDVFCMVYLSFKLGSVAPFKLNDLQQLNLERGNSSPGLAWERLGYSTIEDVLKCPRAFTSVRRFWHSIKCGKEYMSSDCTVHPVAKIFEDEGDGIRVSATFVYPATMALQEACFALPLIELFKKSSKNIGFGFKIAKGGHRRIYNRFTAYKYFFSPRYTDFDKTIPDWLIRIAFDLLGANIDFNAYHMQSNSRCSALLKVWKHIIEYFINTNFRLSNGERYRKNKGLASGSYFTQLVGSIVNWIVTVYSLRSQGILVQDIIVMYDEILAASHKPIDVELFRKNAAKFGMSLDVEKTQCTENLNDIKFLGYYINGGVPKKSSRELWLALRFPEMPDKHWNDFATRALFLLIVNFGNDREFDDCCRNVLKNRYQLKLTPAMKQFLSQLGINFVARKPPSVAKLQSMIL